MNLIVLLVNHLLEIFWHLIKSNERCTNGRVYHDFCIKKPIIGTENYTSMVELPSKVSTSDHYNLASTVLAYLKTKSQAISSINTTSYCRIKDVSKRAITPFPITSIANDTSSTNGK